MTEINKKSKKKEKAKENHSFVNESIHNWELYHKIRSEYRKRHVSRFRLGNLTIKFVYRHAFEKYMDLADKHSWKNHELGMWFKRNLCIGKGKHGKKLFDEDNVGYSYMIGFKLIWLKFWFELSWNVLEIEI